MSNYLTTTNAASLYQTVSNMSNYLTTSAASTTYQTVLSVASATSGLFRLLTTRPGNSTQYIGSLNFPSGSLFGAIISASTPDIINLDDSNFYTTFYTQSQSDTKYATKASPTFTGTATAPTINATTSLQVGGTNINTIYQPMFYATAAIGTNGTVATTGGKVALTCSAPSPTGTYTISWANSGTAPTYAFLQWKTAATPGYCGYSSLSTTGMIVYTYNSSGTLTNASFSVAVVL